MVLPPQSWLVLIPSIHSYHLRCQSPHHNRCTCTYKWIEWDLWSSQLNLGCEVKICIRINICNFLFLRLYSKTKQTKSFPYLMGSTLHDLGTWYTTRVTANVMRFSWQGRSDVHPMRTSCNRVSYIFLHSTDDLTYMALTWNPTLRPKYSTSPYNDRYILSCHSC